MILSSYTNCLGNVLYAFAIFLSVCGEQTFRMNRGDLNVAQGSGDEMNPGPSSRGPTNPGPSSADKNTSRGDIIINGNLYIINFSARNLAIVHSQNIECWEWVKYPSDSR